MREKISEWYEMEHRALRQKGLTTVMAAMMLLSVVNGVAVVGTQPLADGHSGTVEAAAGDEVWNASTGGGIYSSPTVANGMVYVGSSDNSLYAFDADTGTKKWSFATGNGIFGSSPTVANGTVYIGSNDNSLYAIDADTGTKQWSYATGGDISYPSPTVANGTVYIGSSDNSLYAIDADTGTKQWSYATGGQIDSSPTVANGTVYIGSNDNSLYAIDADTGTKQWSHATGGTVVSSPTVANGTVFVGSKDNSLYALDADTGTTQWSYATGGDISYSSPTVANGTVYIGSTDNSLYAIDADTGTKQWSYAAGWGISGSPTVANGIVYIGSWDDSLYALDADTGAKQWNVSTADSLSTSSPIVANGIVYIGSGKNLLSFDTSHSKDSSGSRNKLHTLGHVGPVEQLDTTPTATPTTATPEPQNLTIDTRALFKPNSTHPYSVLLDDVGDVTENATLTISNTTLLSKDTTKQTLTSIDDSNTTATVTLTATHTDADGKTRSVEKQVVIAEGSVENLEILPGGTERGSAVLSDGFFQALLVALFVGVMMTRFTSAFGGLAGGQMVLTIGWFSGYVSWAMAAVSLFVALFIGLNLAANIDYTVRQ